MHWEKPKIKHKRSSIFDAMNSVKKGLKSLPDALTKNKNEEDLDLSYSRRSETRAKVFAKVL